MSAIRIEDGWLRIGARSIPLIAGEIQFWRMHPDTWEPAVRAARDAGITVVSTYLSWRRHESTRGALTFAGESDPRLDVRRFLRICAEAGVLVQLKPGPWICAEEPGGGYPDWLLAREEILARDDAGEIVIGYNPPFQHPVPSYSDGAYLAEVREWFGAVWDAVRDQVHPAGPVIAIQLDNEPSSCFQDSLYGADYSASALRSFRDWLRDRYDDDAARLRDRWQHDHQVRFENAEPPRRPTPGAPAASPARLRDWIEFSTSTTAEYLAELKRMHHQLGGEELLYTVNLVTHPVHDVPVSHASIRDATGAAVGEDHYYIPPLDIGDLHRLARSAATARSAQEPLPWVPELQAGIWRSPGEDVRYPDPTPLEQEIWWGAAVALGFAGVNLYMLADRENWEFAPLGGDGEHTPFFGPIGRLRRLSADTSEALTRPVSGSVLVAWHRPDAYDAYTVTGTSRVPDVPWYDADAARAYRRWDATLQELLARGISYDLWDTESESPVSPSVPLVVPPHCGVSEELLGAIENSGRTVIRLSGGRDDLEKLDGVAGLAPHLVGAHGRLGDTIVTLRTGQGGRIAHVVHWGAGARNVELRIPGIVTTGIRFDLEAGHRVFVLDTSLL